MGLSLHYEKSGASFSIDIAAGVHIYRVLQEALNNVSRHSGSREAWVRLKFQGTGLRLEVEDHGAGIERNSTQPEGGAMGIGLVGMRERAELIGGTLELEQAQGGGTIVRLKVPREKVEAHGG